MVSPSDDGQPLYVRKLTRWLTNSMHIAKALALKCEGGHAHQRLLGGRAKGAERYPDKLCHVIVGAFARQLQEDANDINTFEFESGRLL